MRPRIPQLQCLRTQTSSQCHSVSRTFASTPSSQASTTTQRRRTRDPYAIAQAKARKAANLSRQQVLKKERTSVLGDPIRGTTTPFVRSFDTTLPPEPASPITSTQKLDQNSPLDGAPGPKIDAGNHLNFFLSKEELEIGIERSKWLTQPLPGESGSDDASAELAEGQGEGRSNHIPDFDSSTTAALRDMFESMSVTDVTSRLSPEERQAQMEQEHENAREALKRISSLSLGSSKDRLRVNMGRCIEVFGRHNTDQTLQLKPQATENPNGEQKEIRVGPDTGSSEVQIAILTAKIRALADGLDLRGGPDKVNKRNLRLLVHRRAKLLKYLRRKERGGPRWQNLIETLGLTDGTWKGEISL